MTTDKEQRLLDRLAYLPADDAQESRLRAEFILCEALVELGGNRIAEAFMLKRHEIWEDDE